jgi:hypothetical protein
VAIAITSFGATVDGTKSESTIITDGDPGTVTIWFLGMLKAAEIGMITGDYHDSGTVTGVGAKAAWQACYY